MKTVIEIDIPYNHKLLVPSHLVAEFIAIMGESKLVKRTGYGEPYSVCHDREVARDFKAIVESIDDTMVVDTPPLIVPKEGSETANHTTDIPEPDSF